jgi:hypothetical protein
MPHRLLSLSFPHHSGGSADSSPDIAAALPHQQLPVDAVLRLANLQCRSGIRKAIHYHQYQLTWIFVILSFNSVGTIAENIDRDVVVKCL